MQEWIEKLGFHISLHSPWFFERYVRPELYKRCRNYRTGRTDPEDVHRLAIEMLNRYANVVKTHEEHFDFPELTVSIKNLTFEPFGTAAGADKDGDALIPFSYVHGFQTTGTTPVDAREGNNKPRVAVDDEEHNAYNAQGFPSKGSRYLVTNLWCYRQSSAPQKPIIVNICGLPHIIRESGRDSFVPNKNRVVIAEGNKSVLYKEFDEISSSEMEQALENAYNDTRVLIKGFDTIVDGYEWNVASPNTKILLLLRSPSNFRMYAESFHELAGDKLLQAKMWPYEPEDRDKWLSHPEAWKEGGGDGVTVVNTFPVPREQVPSLEWGSTSAGKSGRFLRPYRRRAVKDARRAFPDLVIFATGGIEDGDDAYETASLGANAFESYTPNMFGGLGLERKKKKRFLERLRQDGYKNLQELQDDVRSGKKLLCDYPRD